MRIETDNLESHPRDFSCRYDVGALVLPVENARIVTDVKVVGRIDRKDREVWLKGNISGGSEVECDRCLKEISLPLEIGFDLTYISAVDYAGSSTGELQEDELAQSVFDGSSIDLDEVVVEQVLLALPARVLCSEQCNGLCPSCGVDRNVDMCNCHHVTLDPRWDALKTLQS